ncbi:hypothetical protein GCM10027277_36720 [Pseudoduganella ginsengisoli]|uniref:Uncharacterized protein n=1 Tax=Pseudoduganella ginsengisoli TaxID=1462440 RepID=A0A6L6PZU9_9BURK|nr:hypothetical protein [Pseudoduganella ginsengisoli]MTW02292.1 hypothetical protein [Pseudoduganella ginsengisoli]
MIASPAFRRIVRASAIYDVLLTFPFATPWTFAAAHALLSDVNSQLGGAPLPAFEPFHLLMACLMGSVVMVWSVLRIRDPQPLYGRYDACARLLFSTWMFWTWMQTGAPLLWLFIVPEFVWFIAQSLPVRAAASAQGKMTGVAA